MKFYCLLVFVEMELSNSQCLATGSFSSSVNESAKFVHFFVEVLQISDFTKQTAMEAFIQKLSFEPVKHNSNPTF